MLFLEGRAAGTAHKHHLGAALGPLGHPFIMLDTMVLTT